jgi:hypothetical protein
MPPFSNQYPTRAQFGSNLGVAEISEFAEAPLSYYQEHGYQHDDYPRPDGEIVCLLASVFPIGVAQQGSER